MKVTTWRLAGMTTMLSIAGVWASANPVGTGNIEAHDMARRSLLRGDIIPLTRALALAAARLPGEVLEVELDEKKQRVVYEIKVLGGDGRVREVLLDARTGSLIRIEED